MSSRFFTTLLIAALFLSGCGFECANSVLTETPSPDGELLAVVYKRDCGATTRENTQICLRSKSKKFDPAKQQSFFVAETEKPVVVTWTDVRKMKITASRDGKVFKNEKSTLDCMVDYEWQ